ncbi:hypothetical protein SUGI_0652640 [Cryptomeria japonica]|nr:hypothetical protein SUGI_0652640 [Cryptomeria japonica]
MFGRYSDLPCHTSPAANSRKNSHLARCAKGNRRLDKNRITSSIPSNISNLASLEELNILINSKKGIK